MVSPYLVLAVILRSHFKHMLCFYIPLIFVIGMNTFKFPYGIPETLLLLGITERPFTDFGHFSAYLGLSACILNKES